MPEIITDYEQGSSEWDADRLGSLGASSMSAVLAKGKGRQDLLEKYSLEIITGEKQEGYSDRTMEEGLIAEPYIRKEYEFITGNEVQTVALIKSDITGLHCSPDGLVNPDGGTEIKKRKRKVQYHYAVSRRTEGAYREKLYSGVPLYPYQQIQTSLFVSRRKWWDYVSCAAVVDEDDNVTFDYSLGNDWIIIQRVYRDESLIKTIEAETKKFLKELDILIGIMRHDA